MLVQEALQAIVSACPPAPNVAAACAQGLVRRLQQQQQQQATAAGRGGRDDPAQLAAALEVLASKRNPGSKAAAERAAAEAGAVGALVRTSGAADVSAFALSALISLVTAAEPSLRLPEAVVAAGGVEAALARLRGPAQEEEGEEQEGQRAAGLGAMCMLLFCLQAHNERSAEEFRRRVLAAGGMATIVQYFVCGMARAV
jgi:hypothetical protein